MTRRRSDILRAGFVLLVVVVGLFAAWGRYGPANLSNAVPQLLVGWTIAGCGVVAWRRVPDSRVGPLLALCGLVLFLSEFSSCLNIVPLSPRCLPVDMFGEVAVQLSFLWTAFLAHALLGYPTGRASSALDRLAVAIAYVAGVLPWLWLSDGWPALMTGSLALVLLVDRRPEDRRARLERRPAVLAGIVMATAMATLEIAWLVRPALQGAGPLGAELSVLVGAVDPLVALELFAVIAAVGLVVGLVEHSRGRQAVGDLVIELGEMPGRAIGDALATALGDPTLEVGFRSDGSGEFVDGAGLALALPPVGSTDRAVLTIEQDGRPAAVLIHDPAIGRDPILRTALAQAAELTETNTMLRAEVRAQLDEMIASRRRLLDAGVDERRELEQRLQDGPERYLATLAAELSDAMASASAHPAIAARLDRAVGQLGHTRAEVRQLAYGLHPRILEERGLPGALADLADRSPVPVELTIRGQVPVDLGILATIYFVASEALANVAKHAAASTVRLSLEGSEEETRLVIADDGVGGADLTDGSGLRGLRDRVEALSGWFEIESPPGHGTRLVATIPSGGEAADRR